MFLTRLGVLLGGGGAQTPPPPLPPHRVKGLKCGFGGLWEMLSIPKVPHGESMPSRVGWDFRTPPHHHHHKEVGCPWEGSVQTPTHRSEEGGGGWQHRRDSPADTSLQPGLKINRYTSFIIT